MEANYKDIICIIRTLWSPFLIIFLLRYGIYCISPEPICVGFLQFYVQGSVKYEL
jgi:hypothetical protein